MVELIGAVRDEIGWEVDLAVDCHWRYSPSDALRLAWELEDVKLLWLEDPTPPKNVEAMEYVTKNTRVPICSGENLYLRHGFRQVLERQAMNVIAPDLQKVGGMLEAWKIADMADAYYIPVAPHNIASPIGTMAACHVRAAIANFLVLEFHADGVPFWNDLVHTGGKPLIADGYIVVPEGPGLEVELNESVAKQYAKVGEPFFFETVIPEN